MKYILISLLTWDLLKFMDLRAVSVSVAGSKQNV